ncbi:enoyl-CoA hydratase/isomerase family protein [Rhodococcus sp. B50]|uniref:enoyl-CoA hydratase/isomerase family protein n=1 Tax=Rhodococcus sp. B50 TaxID=2682847 RepID=UPI001BD33609|nr:enoyl-CoA hydratase/isomerase family protein [Rhodococcus sp. B50]MBS9376487.1 2,3-dehydroadipyl-CoA hydratase [Rhodococcus sp. B50]
MSELLITRAGGVETWTLNRPQTRNALDRTLVAQLGQAVTAAETGGVEVVVLRGAGPSFCAGADLALLSGYDAMQGHTPREHLTAIWDLTLAMERSPVTFVAVLHGHAIAGGLELALACDLVLAATGTLIGDGHVRHSLLAGGGASVRMVRDLGRPTATRLALTGEFLPAEHPAFGTWLHTVAPPPELDEALQALVATLTVVPAAARAGYKHMLTGANRPLGIADRDRELDAFDRNWVDNDVPRALRDFLDKTRKATR